MFLRSGYATLIVSIAIPVSVVASFVAMAAMGRSLNVISLAGIAFAVGMVVDAAIVVLENIYRLRQNGMAPAEAAYQGAKQVWGAILVSALTTVMVFIPILTMELEVGQLFRDIAVAISVAVLLSLLVAMTVIPALSKRLLTKVRPGSGETIKLPVIDRPRRPWFLHDGDGVHRSVVRSRTLAFGVATVVTVGAIAGAYARCFRSSNILPTATATWCSASSSRRPATISKTKTEIAKRVEEASQAALDFGERHGG